MLDQLLAESHLERFYTEKDPQDDEAFTKTLAGRAILAGTPEERRLTVLALLARLDRLDRKASAIRRQHPPEPPYMGDDWKKAWAPRRALFPVLVALLRRKLPLTRDDLHGLLEWCLRDGEEMVGACFPLSGIVTAARHLARREALDRRELGLLARLRDLLLARHPDAEDRKLILRFDELLQAPPAHGIEPGEAWADRVLADLGAMPYDRSAAWTALLAHCRTAAGGAPTRKWSAVAAGLVATVGVDALESHLLCWLPLVERPRSVAIASWGPYQPDPNWVIAPVHEQLLKGLVWCTPRPSPALARALSFLALAAFRRFPDLGPRAPGLGAACIRALAEAEGRVALSLLTMLEDRTTVPRALKEISKARVAIGERPRRGS